MRLGWAEDTSDGQTGPIKVKESFENGVDAFSEQRSVLFKRLFWDESHRTFVYVVWTDLVISGSPQNSISAVAAEPWGQRAPDLSLVMAPAPTPVPAP